MERHSRAKTWTLCKYNYNRKREREMKNDNQQFAYILRSTLTQNDKRVHFIEGLFDEMYEARDKASCLFPMAAYRLGGVDFHTIQVTLDHSSGEMLFGTPKVLYP